MSRLKTRQFFKLLWSNKIFLDSLLGTLFIFALILLFQAYRFFGELSFFDPIGDAIGDVELDSGIIFADGGNVTLSGMNVIFTGEVGVDVYHGGGEEVIDAVDFGPMALAAAPASDSMTDLDVYRDAVSTSHHSGCTRDGRPGGDHCHSGENDPGYDPSGALPRLNPGKNFTALGSAQARGRDPHHGLRQHQDSRTKIGSGASTSRFRRSRLDRERRADSSIEGSRPVQRW